MTSLIGDASVRPMSCALESYTHSYLFARVQHYMQHHDWVSAVFLAERLIAALREQIREGAERAVMARAVQAQSLTEDAESFEAGQQAEATLLSLSQSLEAVQHLLALALYHQHNARRRGGGAAGLASGSASMPFAASCASGGASYAYHLLKPNHQFTEDNQFFFALCAYELGKYTEAEQVLLAYAQPNPTPGPGGPTVDAAQDIIPPKGSQGLLLLGHICHRSSRPDESSAWFHRCLAQDPLCWAAFQALALQGGLTDSSVRGSDFFRVDAGEFCASADAQEAVHAAVVHADVSAPPMLQAQTMPQTAAGIRHAHLLSTPSSARLPQMRRLCLTTPTPRQTLFITPATRGLTGLTPASPAAFLTPPHGGLATPTRGGGGAAPTQSPGSTKRGPRSHQRSLSQSSAGAAAASGAESATRRVHKIGRSALDALSSDRRGGAMTTPSSSATAAAEDSSDDAGAGSERNDKKRRNPRTQTAPHGAKHARTGSSDTPTTPRRTREPSSAAAAAAPPSSSSSSTTPQSARKAPPSASKSRPAAPSKKPIALPGIAESATPDSHAADSSIAPSSAFFTPAPAAASAHVRSRSQDDMDEDDDGASGEGTGTGTEREDLTGTGTGTGTDEDEEAGGEGMREQQILATLTEAASYLTALLQTFAEGCRLVHLYRPPAECTKVYSLLPPHHYHSHRVFTSLARSHFEFHDYATCCELYAAARDMLPGSENLDGTEYYSTALWHRQHSAELSHLASSCVELDSTSAQSWIVVGNCFSLGREHDVALKFFRRAIQCDPHCAYAYTLSAHEYLANDELERAITGYRLALGLDPRAYAAWYGLGSLYLRQEKTPQALYHFQKALLIHPRSSVLHACMGSALHAAHRSLDSLASFRRAEELEPRNPLAKFHRAHVLFALGRLEEARALLLVLVEMVPREASVHLLLGRIAKKQGDLSGAMYRYVTALELDPRDRSSVKVAIDQMHANGLDEEDEEDAAM